MKAWRTNALLLMLTILALSLKYCPSAFAVFAFSPVTLLAIERGNVDATVFFLMFAPMLIFRRGTLIISAFIGLAGALKIFPLSAYLVLAFPKFKEKRTASLLGLIIAAPLILISISELPTILAETTQGFNVSYGLSTLYLSPFFYAHKAEALIVIISFLGVLLAALIHASSPVRLTKLKSELQQVTHSEFLMLSISSIIFVATFVAFNNWAYRLIFVIPAFMVLSKIKTRTASLACINIIAIFWLPILPNGWMLQNLACFSLSIFLTMILAASFPMIDKPSQNIA